MYLNAFHFLLSLSAMIIVPINPETKDSWKVTNTSCFNEEAGGKFFSYFNDRAYKANDVILTSQVLSQATPFYVSGCRAKYGNTVSGLSYQFINDLAIFGWDGDRNANEIPVLKLNPDIKYMTVIMDKKLQFISAWPDLFPRTIIKLGQYMGTTNIFLKVGKG